MLETKQSENLIPWEPIKEHFIEATLLKSREKNHLILVCQCQKSNSSVIYLVVWMDQIDVFSHVFDAFDVFSWLPLWGVLQSRTPSLLGLAPYMNPPSWNAEALSS